VDPNTIVSGNIDEIYGVAVGSRPEVKSSEMSLTASQYGLKIAKGGRIPRLTLNYSVNSGYTYIYDILENDLGIGNESFHTQIKNNRNSGVGLTLNIPILNGWQVNKNISNSKLNVQNSEFALDATKKQLYKNIQQAYTDAVAALIEVAFHDNPEDANFIINNTQQIAEAIAHGICDYVGVEFKLPKVEKEETAEPGKLYRVQVGAFSKKENAENLAAELKSKGYSTIIV
jgi:hypothetical protein